MRKNAELEILNVMILLRSIPVGKRRSIHSRRVERVAEDLYSVDGAPAAHIDEVAQLLRMAHNPQPGAILNMYGKARNPQPLQQDLLSAPAATKPATKPAAKPAAKKANGKKTPQQRAHHYEVLDKRGQVIAYTTTKREAESVCPAGGKVQHL